MKNLNKNILITGSEGQIGKNLINLLSKNNFNLILLDKNKKVKDNYYCIDFNNNKKLKLVTNQIKKNIKIFMG